MRLREAVQYLLPESQGGMGDYCRVKVKDLRELLYHFDRVDNERRNMHADEIRSMEEYREKITLSKEGSNK